MFVLGRKREPPRRSLADGDPPGDVEKVAKIKHLCWVAKLTADSIAGLSPEQLHDESHRYEHDRYQKFLLDATNVARELTGVFYRDSALRYLIDVLMTARDEAQAKRLYSVVEVDLIKEAILREYPRLDAKF